MTMTTCTTCHLNSGFAALGGVCPECWTQGNARASSHSQRAHIWLSVFTQPRLAVRRMAGQPRMRSLMLVLMCGLLFFSASVPWADNLPLDRIALLAFWSIIKAFIGVFIGAELLWLLGTFMGGAAASRQIRAAIVWSLIWPRIVCEFPVLVFSHLLTVLLPSAGAWTSWLPWVPRCCCLGLFTVCLAEMQRFSVVRAALCVLFVVACRFVLDALQLGALGV